MNLTLSIRLEEFKNIKLNMKISYNDSSLSFVKTPVLIQVIKSLVSCDIRSFKVSVSDN